MCLRPQTDFSLHNPTLLASRLNRGGQRLTSTPLREAMHCDPARIDQQTHHPHILCTHTHTQSQAGPTESEVINSPGDYFRPPITINRSGHHINMPLPKETVMGFPCLPNKTHAAMSTCQHECHHHHRFHVQPSFQVEMSHGESSFHLLEKYIFSSYKSPQQNKTSNLF